MVVVFLKWYYWNHPITSFDVWYMHTVCYLPSSVTQVWLIPYPLHCIHAVGTECGHAWVIEDEYLHDIRFFNFTEALSAFSEIKIVL